MLICNFNSTKNRPRIGRLEEFIFEVGPVVVFVEDESSDVSLGDVKAEAFHLIKFDFKSIRNYQSTTLISFFGINI